MKIVTKFLVQFQELLTLADSGEHEPTACRVWGSNLAECIDFFLIDFFLMP